MIQILRDLTLADIEMREMEAVFYQISLQALEITLPT